jgi:hypothetical protein
MLVFISVHFPWNAGSNLELRQSYKAFLDNPVIMSTMTLGNICRREYALSMDAI